MTWRLAFSAKDNEVRYQAGKFLRELYTLIWKEEKGELDTVIRSFSLLGLKEVQPEPAVKPEKEKVNYFLELLWQFIEP